jgi:hypothetical protein
MMLVKALTTAVLLAATLAAPQARAGTALSATIVIARPPAIQVVHHGAHQGHWHKPAYQHRGFARHHRPGKRRHAAGYHRPQDQAASARQHRGGHPPRQHAHRHGKPGGR